jgi:hypothetical protein
MTKIEFTDEHLHVMMTALEVYSRLRAGQIKIAIDTAFRDVGLSWEESESIEKFVRGILYPEPPQLKYDGHGHYYDQYGYTYDENGVRDTEVTWEEKERLKRSELHGNYGVCHEEMIRGGGTLAYEIYSTLRQYVSLKNNDGWEGNGVSYGSPLHITKVPLPVIEGFTAEKRFPIKGKVIVNKLDKAHETKNYNKVWQVIGEYMERKYPELGNYSEARIEREDNYYVVIVKGARKKKDEKNNFA